MSKKNDLNKRLYALLGTTMLATALTAAPASFNFADLTVVGAAAYAKGGDSGSGSDDSDDDNSGSGSSNSGSGSSNSGSGSDDSDDDNSGSGSSNSGHGSGDDDDDHDDDHGGRQGDRHGGRDQRGASTPIPAQFGFVVKAEVAGNHIEIGYSDGWKEEVEDGRYELKNPSNRTVVQRPATQDDINRLSATARASRL